MTQTPSLQTIRAKKDALLASAIKYDALAAKARAEAADYEAAERVWLKLAPESEASVAQGSDSESASLPHGIKSAYLSVSGGPWISVGHSKPPAIPAVPDMIIEALTDAEEHLNVEGLTPSALLSFVRQKYWPDAKNADVGSTAWRMWKEGRLLRPVEGLYALPKAKVTAPGPQLADQESGDRG
jgi:hypothetical protein